MEPRHDSGPTNWGQAEPSGRAAFPSMFIKPEPEPKVWLRLRQQLRDSLACRLASDPVASAPLRFMHDRPFAFASAGLPVEPEPELEPELEAKAERRLEVTAARWARPSSLAT